MVELVSQRIWDFVSGVAFLPVSTVSATKGCEYAAGRVASVKYVYQCLVNTRTEASDISPVDLWVTEGGFTPFPRWTKSRNKLKGPLSWCSWNQHLYCTVCLNQSNGCNYSLYPIRPSRVPLHLGLCKNLRLPTFLKVFKVFFSRANFVFAKHMTHPPWSIHQRCNHRTARWTGEVPPATWPQAVARRDSKPWLPRDQQPMLIKRGVLGGVIFAGKAFDNNMTNLECDVEKGFDMRPSFWSSL